MSVAIHPMPSGFVGEVSGMDITRPLSRDEVAAIEAGMDRYAVLVFPDQPLTDEQQCVQPQFRRAGGDAGRPDDQAGRAAAGSTNSATFPTLTIATGCARATSQAAVCAGQPAVALRRVVPRHRRGLFAAVCAHRAGPAATPSSPTCAPPMTRWMPQRSARSKTWSANIRSCFRARARVCRLEPEAQRARIAPVRHRLVRTHPVTGRKSLYLSSHIGGIVGWPVPEARAFIRDLTEHATQPRVRLRAQVAGERPGDVGQPHHHAPRPALRRPARGARHAPHVDQGHRHGRRAGARAGSPRNSQREWHSL